MKPKSSQIWHYFVVIDGFSAKCIVCGNIYSRKGRTTTALKSHLKSRHIDKFHEFQRLDEAAKMKKLRGEQILTPLPAQLNSASETVLELDQIKQEVDIENCNTFSEVFFDENTEKTEGFDFLAEDTLSKPSCSSQIFNSNKSNSLMIIKSENEEEEFNSEARQYAEDLKALSPDQRNIVRNMVANIMCLAKMSLLSSDRFQES